MRGRCSGIPWAGTATGGQIRRAETVSSGRTLLLSGASKGFLVVLVLPAGIHTETAVVAEIVPLNRAVADVDALGRTDPGAEGIDADAAILVLPPPPSELVVDMEQQYNGGPEEGNVMDDHRNGKAVAGQGVLEEPLYGAGDHKDYDPQRYEELVPPLPGIGVD